MSTVITTQPRTSNIIDLEKKAQENENIKGDTEIIAAGINNDMHLNNTEDDENSQLKEKDEKRKSQEQTRDYKQDRCCVCLLPDDDNDPFCLYYCISSWIRSPLMCTDNCYCGNCKCSCCDSQNAVVDGHNIHNNDDCSGCDCSECHCSGCDCSGCDCSECDCGDCVECCLCFGGLLECCKD